MLNIGMNLGFSSGIGMGGDILQKAMMMATGGMKMSMGINLPGMNMSMTAGMGFGMDSSCLSPEAMMGGGQSSFFHPLMGGGLGSPAMGMGGGMGMVPGMMPQINGQGQQQQQMMMLMMMMMMLMQQQMGQKKPCPACGMPGQGMGQGMPGMGMPGMGMPSMGMNAMGQMPGAGMNPGMGGGPIDLKKGETHTTQSGSTISWQGHTVSVNEPGGGTKQLGGGMAGAGAAAGGAFAFAGAFAGNGMAGAFAGAFAGVGGVAGACGMNACRGKQTPPNKWKVWGDPHINDGSGKQQDFKTNNAMFTLGDGTRVAMCAAGPLGVVEKVRIFPPNVPVNGQTLGGIDPKQTTVYQNKGLEKVAAGTLDQYANYPGMNMSPFGSTMFM